MADKPIIFSGPMVAALLQGRKSQTRRVVKKPAALDALAVFGPASLTLPGNRDLLPYAPGDRLWVREVFRGDSGYDNYPPREWSHWPVSYMADPVEQRQACDTGRVRSPIHMPRWASRLTLTVTDVRVQRLCELTDADAKAEGMICENVIISNHGNGGYHQQTFADRFWNGTEPLYFEEGHHSARLAFAALWANIHGPEAWDANPWVAAISFTVEKRNIDQ